MTVTFKNKVDQALRRAGIKDGEQLEFKVSRRAVTIVPKLTPDELQDEREIRNPKIRAAIRNGYQEYLDGKSRPIEELFAKRDASRG